MSELQDSSEVQQYSSGVLFIMASINPPQELIEPYTESFIESVKTSSVSLAWHRCLRKVLTSMIVLAYTAQSNSSSGGLVLSKSAQHLDFARPQDP